MSSNEESNVESEESAKAESLDITNRSRAYKFYQGVRTDVGKKRSDNQDNYGILHTKDISVFLVADGMGGARGGGTASALASRIILDNLINENDSITANNINSAIELSNKAIFFKSKKEEEFYGMGTTVVVLVMIGNQAIIAHVGDSRIYHLHDGLMYQITRDHTLVQELVDSGAIQESEAAHHPIAHMLTRSLGPMRAVAAEVRVLDEPLSVGDKFLLCSDGLYNVVSDQEIAEKLSLLSPPEAVIELVDLALERGAPDNVTIEVVEVRELNDENVPGFYPSDSKKLVNFATHMEVENWQKLVEKINTNDEEVRDVFERVESDAGQDKAQDLEGNIFAESADEVDQTSEISIPPAYHRRSYGSSWKAVFAILILLFGYQILFKKNTQIIDLTQPLQVEQESQLVNNLEVDRELLAEELAQLDLEPQIGNTLPTTQAEELVQLARNIEVPDMPPIALPRVTGDRPDSPIVWEHEDLKIQRLSQEEMVPAFEGDTLIAKPAVRIAPVLSDEEAELLSTKKNLVREKISDLDYKLQLLVLNTDTEVLEKQKIIEDQIATVNGQIKVLVDSIDVTDKEYALLTEYSKAVRSKKRIEVGEYLTRSGSSIKATFDSYLSASKKYEEAVSEWQKFPGDFQRASVISALGRALQQKREELEKGMTGALKSQRAELLQKLAEYMVAAEKLETRQSQLGRHSGYIEGFIDLSGERRQELLKNYMGERTRLLDELRLLQAKLPDNQEFSVRRKVYEKKIQS